MCQERDSLIWITNKGGEIVQGQIHHVGSWGQSKQFEVLCKGRAPIDHTEKFCHWRTNNECFN